MKVDRDRATPSGWSAPACIELAIRREAMVPSEMDPAREGFVVHHQLGVGRSRAPRAATRAAENSLASDAARARSPTGIRVSSARCRGSSTRAASCPRSGKATLSNTSWSAEQGAELVQHAHATAHRVRPSRSSAPTSRAVEPHLAPDGLVPWLPPIRRQRGLQAPPGRQSATVTLPRGTCRLTSRARRGHPHPKVRSRISTRCCDDMGGFRMKKARTDRLPYDNRFRNPGIHPYPRRINAAGWVEPIRNSSTRARRLGPTTNEAAAHVAGGEPGA